MARQRFPKILFLDMEGTLLRKAYHLDDGLVAPSAWTLVAERLGKECLEAENDTKRTWREGGYRTYMDWMQATIEIHRQYGLSENLFTEVIESAELMDGATQLVEAVHAEGAVTVLITGGFKALADKVQRTLRLRHSFAACEYFFDETGALEHWNLLPADEAGKVDFMRLICDEYGVEPLACAFIGDGMNDVHLARTVGFSIAFNAQKELEDVASVKVRQPVGKETLEAAIALLDREWG
jgi:phosphoserine phosphatase